MAGPRNDARDSRVEESVENILDPATPHDTRTDTESDGDRVS